MITKLCGYVCYECELLFVIFITFQILLESGFVVGCGDRDKKTCHISWIYQ